MRKMYKDTMDKFYHFISMVEAKGLRVTNTTQLPINLFPENKWILIKALLEDRFHPRKFSIEEVKGLIEQALPHSSLEREGDKLIPKWYKDKYFHGKEASRI